MSTTTGNNGGCGKTLLYLLLGGAGLWVGARLLRLLYYAFSYLGANALLALDLSAYGQLSAARWPGYVLLGLGLGAAGGTIAAQRRFGLARAVAVAGWLGGLALLAVLYATVDTDQPLETDPVAAEPLPTPAAAAPAADPTPAPAPAVEVRPAASPTPPDTSSQAASGQRQVLLDTVPLHTSWTDSLTSPVAYLHGGETVDLQRQAHGWVQVGSYRVGVGWVRQNSLGSLEEQLSLPAEEASPAKPAVEKLPQLARKAPKPKSASPANPDSVRADTHHPLGHQQHAGQINDLAVTYTLDWQPNGELSGSYRYDQQPGTIHRLSGAILAGGRLQLLEFTRGRQSAQAMLQRQGSRYTGTLVGTDGQQLAMSLE